MANSPQNSPPAPSEGSSSSSPPPSTKSSTSAPTPNGSSASPPPPAPPQSPPPSKESPPPQTKENSPPPPSQGSSSSAPAPPGSSSNQSLPQFSPPPLQGANDGRNNDRDNNKKNKERSGNDKNKESSNDKHNKNNNSGNSNDRNTFSLPSSQKDKDSGNGNHSPPRSLGPPTGSSKSSGDGDSKDIAKVIGVVAGAGLLLLFVILLCVCCKRKKKRRSKLDHMQYYNASPFGDGTGGGGHYNNVPPQHHQNDNVMNLPPHAGGNRGATLSPQPPVSSIHGSNNDSSNFSGQYGPSPPPHSPMALGFNQSTFTYDELAMATQGFSQANILGQGGFGYVYKGVLPNGKEVAVKSLKTGSGQGEREFQAEVDIISRVHHRHLVSLVGYCIAGDQRMLVYEFLPNNTLEFHLYGKGRPVMDWPTRMKIALGSAKGLAYLHEDCQFRIIHRDIKAANILLDFSFEAKVADFGLAKLSQDNFTHVSTRVMGTFGYLAPEYASSGKLTEKSDVFSFGVMLLELITGRPPVDLTGEMEDSLVDWARPLCLKAAQDGDYSALADQRLEGNYEQHEMARMAASAAAAIRHSARRRPKMSQIVRALEGDVSLDDLNEGVRPGQSTYFGSATGSSEHNAGTYSADMRRFRQLVLDSQDYESSEYSATSEYALNNYTPSSDEMHKRKL